MKKNEIGMHGLNNVEIIAKDLKTDLFNILHKFEGEILTRATKEAIYYELVYLFNRYELEEFKFKIIENIDNSLTIEPIGNLNNWVLKGILSE